MMTRSFASSLLVLASALCCLIIAIIAITGIDADNRQQQAALCQDPATLIYKFAGDNQVFGTAAIFNPPGLPTTTGESTSIIFPAVVGLGGRTVALSALSGVTDWSYILSSPVRTSPVTSTSVKGGVGHSVYFGADDGRIYAVDASVGNRQWSYTTGDAVRSSPLFWNDYRANNFYVFAGSNDNQLYAIKVDPQNRPEYSALAWNFTTGDSVISTPCITDYYYLLVFGSSDGRIYAMSPRTGRHYWNMSTGSASVGSCTIAPVRNADPASQVIYIGDGNGNLHCMDLNGTVVWTKKVSANAITAAPSVGAIINENGNLENVVFVSTNGEGLICLKTKDGSQVWDFKQAGVINSAPVLSSGSKNYQSSSTAGTESTSAPFNVLQQAASKFVYISDMDGNVFQLNATTGTRIWNYTITGAGNVGIPGSPALDHSTGVLYFGSLDKNFYAVLAEPSCLPTCNVIPRAALVPGSSTAADAKKRLQAEEIIFARKSIADISKLENGDDDAFEAMRGAAAWHSEAQSIVFHNTDYESRKIQDGAVTSESIDNWNSYAFFPLNQLVDWEGPVQAASGTLETSSASSSSSPCSVADGCETVLPCVGPILPSLADLKQTEYTVPQLCQYWNEGALFALFEFSVALATSKNTTFARQVFEARADKLGRGASDNTTCKRYSFATAQIIANYGKSGFVCSSHASTTDSKTSSTPHFVLSASYLGELTPGNHEWATFSFDATAYAEQVDAAMTQSTNGAYVSKEAVNLLSGVGGQSFLSYCSCSSCAPYITTDNNAIPWLFLICAAIKTVIVSFKLTNWVSNIRNLFLRRRTAASSELLDETGNGTKENPKNIRIKKRNDPVQALRQAQREKDEQRRLNAATFFNSAEVQRRIQRVIDERTFGSGNEGRSYGGNGDDQNDDNNNNQEVGRDFVKFYLNQFSAPSASFAASSITGAFEQAARKEKIVDVVVPDLSNNKQATQKVAELLAVLDKVFENLVEVRGSAANASNMSVRESQGFAGFMSSILRASGASGFNNGTSSANNNKKSGLLGRASQQGQATYGAASTSNLGSATALRDSSTGQQQESNEEDNNNNTVVPVGQSAKQVYYAEVRQALKSYKKLQLDHPEWFEIITVVIHRSPKNPFLPSRLILALAAIYALIYYIVSFIDAFLWLNFDRLVVAGEDSAHSGSATASESWLRYEAFAWRIMNSTIFPLLFVNCIFANWQYTSWTKSEASIISSRMNRDENPSASGENLMNNDAEDEDEEDLNCCQKFSRFFKSLSQHFEGRVAIVSFFLMLPMILTHCILAIALYCWIVVPVFFFCIFTPAAAIAHFTSLLHFDAVERQHFNLNRSLKTNLSLPEGQSIPSTIYQDADGDSTGTGFCNCCSSVNSRRRTIIFIAYGVIFFFACALFSWTFNVSLLYVYDANGSVHVGQDGNNGNRYVSAMGWEFESRSPVCAVDTYWMSSSAILRNAAAGFTPF